MFGIHVPEFWQGVLWTLGLFFLIGAIGLTLNIWLCDRASRHLEEEEKTGHV